MVETPDLWSPSLGVSPPDNGVFRPIRTPQALGSGITILAKDLKTEEILPLGPTYVQRSDLSLICAEKPESIVLKRLHIPKMSLCIPLCLGKIAEHPLGQINQMRTLIQKLPTTGFFGNGPPLAIITGPSAMAITPANAHQRANLAGRAYLIDLLYTWVIAVIITNF